MMTKSKSRFGAMSALVQRLQLGSLLGVQFGGARDLYQVFGYKKTLTFEDYLAKYTRNGIAKRIVNAPPDATWRASPDITFQTDSPTQQQQAFADAWSKILSRADVLAAINKADKLAGLGNFSVIFLGFDDGKAPNIQVQKANLLYLQPFAQAFVEILDYDNDIKSPRFGLPTMYRIDISGSKQDSVRPTMSTINPIQKIDVHYSRIVHIAEDAIDNGITGTPRLESVFNWLDDLEKLVGGTSETFWLCGSKGMQVDLDAEADLSPEDENALSDEIDEYQNQLRRVIRTRNVKINDLGGKVPDPKNNFDVIFSLLSGSTGIPKRILTGAEMGQLASDQDRANWADRVKERRVSYAEPIILCQLAQRLQQAKILPVQELNEVLYKWPTNFQLTPLEESQSQAQRSRALANLSATFEKNPLVTVGEAREIVGLPYEPPEALPEATNPGNTVNSNTSANDVNNPNNNPDNNNNM